MQLTKLPSPILLFAAASVLGFGFASTPVQAAVPSWDNLTTIFYDPTQDGAEYDYYGKTIGNYMEEAASELKSNLEQVSGKTFTIDTSEPPSQGIYLRVDPNNVELVSKNEEAFKLFTDESGIHITGKTPIAVRHGAYTLLERLGYRWFFKNPVWFVKPSSLFNLTLNEVQEPTFEYRKLFYWEPRLDDQQKLGEWEKANKMPGPKFVFTRHSYPGIISDADRLEHPEWECGSGGQGPPQIDVTNPDVLQRGIDFARNELIKHPEWLAVSIEPADGNNWGGCPFAGSSQEITNAVFNFTNEIAKAIKDEFPDRYVSTLSYSVHSLLPDIEQFEDNVMVIVATNFSALPVHNRLEYFAERGAVVGIYDYTDLNGKDMQQYIDNVRLLKQFGGQVHINEGGGYWGERGIIEYILSKLKWDPNSDVEGIKQDFYDKAFGPASATMKRFFERHDGQSYGKRRVLALSFNDLAQAEAEATGHPEIIERIRHLQYYLRYQWQTQYDGEPYNLSDPNEEQQWADFLCSLTSTNVLWNIQFSYQYGGFSSYWDQCLASDWRNLPPPPPTAAQAQQWMNEALTAFADEQLIDIWPVIVDKNDLVPLNVLGYPELPILNGLGRNNYYVKIDQQKINNDSTFDITVEFFGSGETPHVMWYDPDSILLVDIYGDIIPPTNEQTQLQLPLTKPGVYRLRFFTHWCCSGTFKFLGFDVPVSADTSDFYYLYDSDAGYMYVPENIPAFAAYSGNGIIKLTAPDGEIITQNGKGEKIIENPKPGIWTVAFSSVWRSSYEIYGIPPLLWPDAENLLVPASSLPLSLPPSSFSVTSLNSHYLFQEEDNTFEVAGSFDTSLTYTLKFSQAGVEKKDISVTPTDTTTLRTTVQAADLSSLSPGLYDMVVERSTDNTTKTYATQIAITKRGDLWSSSATDSSLQKRDGKIDLYDVSRMLSKWGSTQAADLQDADISSGPNNISQNKIDLYDANLMMRNWTG